MSKTLLTQERQDAISRLMIKRRINAKLRELGVGPIYTDRGVYHVDYATMAKLVGITIETTPTQDCYEIEVEMPNDPDHLRKYKVTLPARGCTVNTAMCTFEFFDPDQDEWTDVPNISRQNMLLEAIVDKYQLHELVKS